MICIYLPNTSFFVFMNIMEEFICGEGIHKTDSYAIISDFLCRAFYLVIPKCIPNVASSVYLVLATPNVFAHKWRKGSKEVRHDFIQMSLILGKTVQERGFVFCPWVAILAPTPGFFPQEKMNNLTQHIYSTICKTKIAKQLCQQEQQVKKKKGLFHKINSMGEKIKMNGRGRESNQDNKWWNLRTCLPEWAEVNNYSLNVCFHWVSWVNRVW